MRGGLKEGSLFSLVSSALKFSRSEALVSGCINACSDILRHTAILFALGQGKSRFSPQGISWTWSIHDMQGNTSGILYEAFVCR